MGTTTFAYVVEGVDLNEKQVSIIVPIYNIRQYLDKCLSSIITQSYQNLEIILVDDGSTDDTPNAIGESKSSINRMED